MGARSVEAMAVLLLLLAPAHAAGQEDGLIEAKEHFDKGVELFKNSDFPGALVEFKAAYKTQPHFAVRYNVGITLYKLKRYGDAHAELSAYIAEGGDQIPGDKRKEVEEILESLESLLGTITVETNVPDATLLVDGKPVDGMTVTLEVGEYELEVRAPGRDPVKRTVELPGGESLTVQALFGEVEEAPGPEPAMKKRGRLPPAALWSMLGVTLAIGAGAAVTGAIALKTNRDFQDLSFEDPDWESVQARGMRLSLATDILLGATGAAALTTILLAVFTDFGKEEGDVSLLLCPSHQGLALGFRGTF